jgi:hypothetical protein
MSVRVRPDGTEVDRPVLAMAVVAVVTAVGALWMASSTVGGRYRTGAGRQRRRPRPPGRRHRPDGGRLGLGLADPEAVTTFVVSYGGQEVWRQGYR